MAKLYKNWTVQEKICAMLLATGYVEQPSKSEKYRTFALPKNEGWLFVGKMGSTRINRSKPTHTDSINVATRYRDKLAAYERENQLA